MKIGMLVDTYLPIMGGAEIHVLELSRFLRRRGHEIAVCTAIPGSPDHPDEEFPLLRIPSLTGGNWKAAMRVPLALPALLRFLRKVDIIHCHYSFLLAALGVLLGRWLGKPAVVTLHGLGTLDSSVGKSALRRLYRWLSLRFAAAIIATSEEMRTVALRYASPERIRLIPNGVDAAVFAPQSGLRRPGSEFVILSMRRLAPKNGVQYLVEAAPRVVRAVPQARFWITGEGKLESHIRRRVAELSLEDYVRFIGIVDHAETPGYYQQADLVVFPSSAESTSLACLEAMCMEKAIVASSLAPYKEMLGEAGERGALVDLFDREGSDYNAPLSLPPERIEALAQAIIRLAQQPDTRRAMGSAARQFAIERYDWRLIAARTEELYQVASRRAPG